MTISYIGLLKITLFPSYAKTPISRYLSTEVQVFYPTPTPFSGAPSLHSYLNGRDAVSHSQIIIFSYLLYASDSRQKEK